MATDSVKVAVRVRPFNQREIDRQSKLIIEMNGKTTSIRDPKHPNAPKTFTFDYSYWSHDGFQTDENGVMKSTSSKYASQDTVFQDLGKGVLNNAWQGYNCSLFAYGQTGSGKSYSMVGYGFNKGIVPITCNELFKSVGVNADPNKKYEITLSMLEIYNEQVRDLLSKTNPKGGLPVRQNPKLGMFYVQNLKHVPVGRYEEIEKRMEQGTAMRTVASTNMNATSSRAHTVVTITFSQIVKNESGETKKTSIMNLVDLAGSERAGSTGATGDRLKEGANINKSLSALGNVISALADNSTGKKTTMVPYRDSVLTKLLQNALGGNSKTVMIAALSPADINYDETLSTLRYADRAKQIKNKAVVNENPLTKVIRELKEENEKLKASLAGGGLLEQGSQGLSAKEKEKMRKEMEEEIRAQLLANQEMLAGADGTGPSWEEKLAVARTDTFIQSDDGVKKKQPHLTNLNEDPMLSGVVLHALSSTETTIGRKQASHVPNICLNGLSIMEKHAVISFKGGEYELRPAVEGAKTKLNGAPITGAMILKNKDRILFGSNHWYVFVNPQKADKSDLPEEITWEFAQKELAQAKGFTTGGSGLTRDQQIAQEQVLEIVPMVSEVNAISEELNKRKTFEVVLVSAAAQEGIYGEEKGTKVMVKMKDLLNSNTWLWERAKFMNRRFLMQDMYQSFLDGEQDISSMNREEDPFWEPTEDVLIGTCNVFLQSLAYALDFDDRLAITDYKGQEEGTVTVNVTPCTETGNPLDEDYFVDDPQDLINKPYHFKVSIKSAEINKVRFVRGLHVSFRVFKDTESIKTKVIKGTLSPEFNFSKIVSFPSITHEHLTFFETGVITFMVYAVQEDIAPDAKLSKMTTKELRQMEHLQKPSLPRSETVFSENNHGTAAQLKSEYVLLQRKFQKLSMKEKRIQEICKEWEKKVDEEKKFEPFYRTVSAVAFSTGTKLKTNASVINKCGDMNDTISVYVFGEDEEQIATGANKNGGLITRQQLCDHYGDTYVNEHLITGHRYVAKNNGTKKTTDNPGKAEVSKTCVVQ